MGQFFSLKNSKFFSGLKKNWPIVTPITTDRPAHQCSRDVRHLTSDLYTSLIWFKSAQLAEF